MSLRVKESRDLIARLGDAGPVARCARPHCRQKPHGRTICFGQNVDQYGEPIQICGGVRARDQPFALRFIHNAGRARLPDDMIGNGFHEKRRPLRALRVRETIEGEKGVSFIAADKTIRKNVATKLCDIVGRNLAALCGLKDGRPATIHIARIFQFFFESHIRLQNSLALFVAMSLLTGLCDRASCQDVNRQDALRRRVKPRQRGMVAGR